MHIDELKQTPLFQGYSDSDLRHLLASPHRRQTFVAGSLVMRLGDPCLSLMVLTSGTVETRMRNDEGREVVVERLKAPSLLGPIFLFADDNTMPVEVQNTADAVIWFINREGFASFIDSHPRVMATFLQSLAEKGHFLADRVRHFATMSIWERVLDHLDTHGPIASITAAAEMLGVNRSALSRVLATMQADGLIVRSAEGLVRK